MMIQSPKAEIDDDIYVHELVTWYVFDVCPKWCIKNASATG